MKNILFLMMDGFEEIEAVVPIDILRRLEFNLVISGIKDKVSGAHGLELGIDVLLNLIDFNEFDAVILPGGMPGSTNLRDSGVVVDIVKAMYEHGKIVAAICAAPIVLAKAGIMKGVTCTAYPMDLTKEALKEANLTGTLIERDDTIITGKGPGAAFAFAFEIAKVLGKEFECSELRKNMFLD